MRWDMTGSMSASLLPPLTLTVGKAPVYSYPRRQKSPTASQRAVLSLLKKRHERYLAAQRDHLAGVNLQAAACKPKDALIEPDISNGRTRMDVFSFPRQGSRSSSLLNDLECSDLAEHVMRRAKVRLRRRQKGRGLLSLRNKAHGQPSSPAGGNQRCSDGETKGNLPALSNTRLCTSAETVLARQTRTHETRKGHRGFRQKEANRSTETLTSNHVRPSNQEWSSQLQNARERTLPGSDRLGESSPESPQVPAVRQRVVYQSEKQSESTTGIPNAPPTTPSTAGFLVSCKYIPSLQDVKSQRLLKARLEQISAQLKEKSKMVSQAAQHEEDRKRREATAKLKAQRRAEIYALNKVMTEYEEQKFQALLSAQV